MQEQINRNEIKALDKNIENIQNQIAGIKGQQKEGLRIKKILQGKLQKEIIKRDNALAVLDSEKKKNGMLIREHNIVAERERKATIKVKKEEKKLEEGMKLNKDLTNVQKQKALEVEKEYKKMQSAKRDEVLAKRDHMIAQENIQEQQKKQKNQKEIHDFSIACSETKDFFEKKKKMKDFDKKMNKDHDRELILEIETHVKQLKSDGESLAHLRGYIDLIANFANKPGSSRLERLGRETEHFEDLTLEKNLEATIQLLILMFKKINQLPKEKLETVITRICSELNFKYENLKLFAKNNTRKKGIEKVMPKKFDSNKDKSRSFHSTSQEIGDQINIELMREIHFWNEKRELLYELYAQFEQYLACVPNFANYDPERILLWAKIKNGKLESAAFPEALAIINRANIIVDGYQLRDVQVFAALLSCRDIKKGKLVQINTGEGKTTITSIVAVLKSLQNDSFVDIITSNDILAEEAVKSRDGFYALFGKSVSHNKDDNYVKGLKPCYAFHIVYGTIANFQIDYLRQNFKLLGNDYLRKKSNFIF